MDYIGWTVIWIIIGIRFLFHALMAYASRKKEVEGYVKRAFLSKGIDVDDMTLQRCAEECDVPRMRYNLFSSNPYLVEKRPWYKKISIVFSFVLVIIFIFMVMFIANNNRPHYYQYKELTVEDVRLTASVCEARFQATEKKCIPNSGKKYYVVLVMDYSQGKYCVRLISNNDELSAHNKTYNSLDDPLIKKAYHINKYLTGLVTTKVEKHTNHYQISFDLNFNQDIINWMNQEEIGVSVSLVGTNGTVTSITDGISFDKDVEFEGDDRSEYVHKEIPMRQYVIGDQVMMQHLDSDISVEITNTQYYPNLYRLVFIIIFCLFLFYIWLVLRDYRIQGLIYKEELIYLLEQRYNVEIDEDLRV